MRRIASVLATLAVMASLPALAQPSAPVAAGLQDALRSLDEAIATLERSKPSRVTDRALRQMADARTRLVEALRALEPPRPPRFEQPLPAGPGPLDPGKFRDLMNDLKGFSFSSEQLAYLRDASKHHHFVTEQVRQVVAIFDFGKDKIEAATILYPRTLDKSEFYQVQKELTFESDREALRKALKDIDRAGLPPGGARP